MNENSILLYKKLSGFLSIDCCFDITLVKFELVNTDRVIARTEKLASSEKNVFHSKKSRFRKHFEKDGE